LDFKLISVRQTVTTKHLFSFRTSDWQESMQSSYILCLRYFPPASHLSIHLKQFQSPWRWRQQFSPKCRSKLSNPQGWYLNKGNYHQYTLQKRQSREKEFCVERTACYKAKCWCVKHSNQAQRTLNTCIPTHKHVWTFISNDYFCFTSRSVFIFLVVTIVPYDLVHLSPAYLTWETIEDIGWFPNRFACYVSGQYSWLAMCCNTTKTGRP
jgi:hypothetical protein